MTLPERDLASLFDILDSIELIESYLSDQSLETFEGSTKVQDAVLRRLTIIGEASRRLTEDTLALLPQVPWRSIRSFRNLVTHDYDGVSLQVVWQIVQEDLPTLREQLRAVVEQRGD